MHPNKPFRWTKKTNEAARVIALGGLTYVEIARRFGVHLQTLVNWRAHPEFKIRIAELEEEFRQVVRARGVAMLEKRVEFLNERWEKMREVIEERALAQDMEGVAGGRTGLVVKSVKSVRRGDDFELVPIYEVDTGLLRELREHEKQAAQELGQWTEKREVGGSEVNPVIVKVVKGVSYDDL
jgi:transposase-like protein